MRPKGTKATLRQRAAARISELAGLLLCLMFAAAERLESLRQGT